MSLCICPITSKFLSQKYKHIELLNLRIMTRIRCHIMETDIVICSLYNAKKHFICTKIKLQLNKKYKYSLTLFINIFGNRCV